MSKLTIFSLLILSLLAYSCKEIDRLLTFEIEDSQNITFSTGFPLNNDVVSLPMDVTTNSEEEFRNNDTRAEFVKDVTLKKLTLTITNPPAENFSFLKNVYIYISMPDGSDEIQLAFRENIPDDVGNTLELYSKNEKLDKYIKASSFKIRTKTTFDKSYTKEMTIRADMKFKVVADPLQ